MTSPQLGTPVHFDHRKWDGSQHWQVGGVFLGTDRWGRWVGVRPGARIHRPGHEFWADVQTVHVIPSGHPWMARFYDRPDGLDRDSDKVQVYVDISSIPEWHLEEDPPRVSLIDLDLDVIRRGDLTFIDDEDEFAEHQVRFGYPAEVVERAEQAATDVLRQVTDRTGPFAPQVAARWFAVLSRLSS